LDCPDPIDCETIHSSGGRLTELVAFLLKRGFNYDSVAYMGNPGIFRTQSRDHAVLRLPENQLKQGLALVILLVLTGMAIAGPTGLLAWNENAQLLQQREAQIAVLQAERDRLQNRVELLHPEAADPDLIMEMLRKNMNVVHEDEVVIELDGQ